MRDTFLFLYHRFREQLWARPLVICGLSVTAVFVAKAADQISVASLVPDVSVESLETLLKVIAASMLVMAIFSVGSMVSAYASASNNATPRAFPLVIADDVSQNALTAFIGAFIFSIVALFALQNGYYDQAGRFTLLLMTFLVFAVVILTLESCCRVGSEWIVDLSRTPVASFKHPAEPHAIANVSKSTIIF